MSRLSQAAQLVVVASAFGLMLWRSWRQWPDVLIDTGRELYVPWQMNQGQVLYQDIVSFYGPWSSGFNALVFKAVGAGIAQLFVVNALVLIGACGLMYWMARQCAGRWPATAGVVLFILLMAFGQYDWISGNNWMLPYSHEMTHGVFLSLAGTASVLMFARGGRLRWLFASGLCLGVVLMTKPEPTAALLMTQILVLAMPWVQSWRRAAARTSEQDVNAPQLVRCRPVGILWMLAGVLFPLVVSTMIFWRYFALSDALAATFGAWQFLGSQVEDGQKFHQVLMGMHEPWTRLLRMFCWTGGVGGLLVLAWLAGRYLPGVHRGVSRDWARDGGVWAGVLILLAGGGLMAAAIDGRWIRWSGFAFPLPLVMTGLLCHALWRYWRGPSWRWLALGGLAMVSLLLLGRIILNVNISYYGLFLAAPALVLATAYVCGPLVCDLKRRGGSPWPLWSTMAVMVCGLLWAFMSTAGHYERQNTIAVGRGVDRFYTHAARGEAVNAVLSYLREHARPGQTLVVMPEGVMLNFLLRMPSSVPYVNYIPVEFTMHGEDRILAALKKSPPTYIALAHKNTLEYGPEYFGKDYGQEVMAWMKQRYEPVALAGRPPFTDQGFGIMVVKLKPAEVPVTQPKDDPF